MVRKKNELLILDDLSENGPIYGAKNVPIIEVHDNVIKI